MFATVDGLTSAHVIVAPELLSAEACNDFG